MTDSLLECVLAIEEFLNSCIIWESRIEDEFHREVMHTDVGYFFEGLEELKEYLERYEFTD